MTTDRIEEIQKKTAYPDSISVQQALLQVWNECQQDMANKKYTEEEVIDIVNINRKTGLMADYIILRLNK
jgi:antitoxin component HigA of HigAB toxin-antitoxin module